MSNISTRLINHMPVIKLPRLVNHDNADELLYSMRREIQNGRRVITLDLGATEAIDSRGLKVIVNMFKSLRIGEGDLLLANVCGGVERLFAMLRLDAIMPIFASVGEAVATSDHASQSASQPASQPAALRQAA